jgi:hypothetical protein
VRGFMRIGRESVNTKSAAVPALAAPPLCR